jgi:D-glycero-D-manno-heptose 1,7-bisphosphate phosphatase
VTTGSFSNKVVVLDRDGTIVIDREYLSDPAGLEFMPGAAESLRRLHGLGYRLVIATNQSGVGRGMYTLDQLHKIHERLNDMVQSAGASLAGIYYCPHAPEVGCLCRKPAPGLLVQAASELGFDPSASIVVGDKLSDVEFGQRAGATTILLSPHRLPKDAPVIPNHIVGSLLEAAQTIHDFYD